MHFRHFLLLLQFCKVLFWGGSRLLKYNRNQFHVWFIEFYDTEWMDNCKIWAGSHFVKYPDSKQKAGNDIPSSSRIRIQSVYSLVAVFLQIGNGSCYSMDKLPGANKSQIILFGSFFKNLHLYTSKILANSCFNF